jgi:hypothetical protein
MLIKNIQGYLELTKNTYDTWISNKVIPPEGSVLYIPDLKKFLIGNGTSTIDNLKPINIILDEVTDSRITIDNITGRPLWNGSPWPGTDQELSGLSYEHIQTTPDEVWTIDHNKNKWPFGILIFDDTNAKITSMEDWSSSTLNTFILRFAIPVAGKALFRF